MFSDYSGATRVIFIVGDPIAQVKSPHGVTEALRARGADAIVAQNVRDFPAAVLQPYGMEAVPPDTFFLQQFGIDQAKVLSAVKDQRASMKKPAMPSLEFLDLLERQGLPLFISELRRYADVI